MRLTQLWSPTLKESPKEAEVISHQLLLRAGYIRKLAAGIYTFLPLGWRVVRKVEDVIREEMDRAGAQEIRLPTVQPAELWEESGRWEKYGPELMRLKDRKGGNFCLGPTHEEVITDLVRGELRSYRQLPLNLYQFQTKFRDELRPRAGLMRGREFIMKDAYSFDLDEEAARESYERMRSAYDAIFTRLGLAFRPVEADSGNIGGSLSHEYQVLAETGEDAIVSCPDCGYTANVEKAELGFDAGSVEEPTPLGRVDTPGARTIDEVSAMLGVTADRLLKTLVYDADGSPVVFVVPGGRDLNEVKAERLCSAESFAPAGAAMVEAVTGAAVGFAGPVGLDGVRVVVDRTLEGAADRVCGANETDVHLTGVMVRRDVEGAEFADLLEAGDGDRCGRCGGRFAAFRGIEVGHVFHLGTRYSEALGARVLDEEGTEVTLSMGCYGIGVTRILAAAVEQHHDGDGIRWPMVIAPYQVLVVPLQLRDERVVATAESIYERLGACGVEVLIDDRDLRPGNKFKDADLLGIPLRVTVGSRGVEKGQVELKARDSDDVHDVAIEEVVDRVASLVRGGLSGTGR
ncbi:MAG: proline--tRNA ligase [Deltaproteobacteria bacterium]|nr:MAG: proline--tRNA ligase [Deltaproteobacteria bacterium]